ncbi:hypothetical protein AMTRI_Chr09g42060 [Amborella trichopoda]
MILPNQIASLLRQPKTLTISQARQAHALLLTSGLLPHLLAPLLSAFLAHRATRHAHLLFHHTPDPSPEAWTAMVRGLARHTLFAAALRLYTRNPRAPAAPTLCTALSACARFPAPLLGRALHAQAVALGFGCHAYVQTGLVDMYSKHGESGLARQVFDEMPHRTVVSWNALVALEIRGGNLAQAHRVFDEMPERDTISWNSLIAGYAKVGNMVMAMDLFEKMPIRSAASWNSIICGYIECGDMELARKVFDEMPERNLVSWIAMISGYSKKEEVGLARELFHSMGERDLASWNAMVSCYAQNNHPHEAISLFREMLQSSGLEPNQTTMVGIVSSCSQIGDLLLSQWLEEYINRTWVEPDDYLITALIDMHAKCGSMNKAHSLFQRLKGRDVVSYSAMIVGFAIHGLAKEALMLYVDMLAANVNPNRVTFIGVLTACNHAGLVEEGLSHFGSMISYGIEPSMDHYACMVDLLGRARRLEEAHDLIKSMPMRPDAGVWGALLLACRIHGNVELGEIAGLHCLELEPDTGGYYVLLSNIYAASGRWEDAQRLREVMVERGLMKTHGCSWVEVRNYHEKRTGLCLSGQGQGSRATM